MKGEGPLQSVLERALAADRKLADAVVLEHADTRVQPLMRDSDLLLVTSAMEGIAYVSYEAMAMGLVQISTAVGGQPELIAPGHGVLIETGDDEIDRFAEAVIELLGQPDRLETLAAAARERIGAWPSVSDMAQTYKALYESLVGELLSSGAYDHLNSNMRGRA